MASLILFSIGLLPFTAWHFYEWAILGSVFTVFLSPIFLTILLPCLVFLFLLGNYLPMFILEIFEIILVRFENFLEFFRFSNIIIGQPNFGLMIFSILLLLWIIETKQNNPLQSIFYAMIITCLFIGSRFFQLGSSITFSDVGQGDSIFFVAPFKKETIMVDTGGKVTFQKEGWQERIVRPHAEYNLIPFLKGQGISRINKLILTHDDLDHVGELATLEKHFKIDAIYIGQGAGKHALLNQQLKSFIKNGTTIYEVKQGDQINGYFDFFVLSPDKKGSGHVILF